jgi:hypothetical protein
MDEHASRIARTEALFRDVNERISEAAQRFDSDDAEFVCECADAECTDRIPASLDDYEHVRAEGTRFLLLPGHEDTRVERVVRSRRRYRIVEKFERSIAAMVKRLDPRAAPS